jgi:GNAT superfamily N-acetyltransferase
VRLFHAGLMTTNFIGDELEPVEEWEGMLSADASERAGLGALGNRESACGFAEDVPYEIEFHLFMLAEVAAQHVGEVDADGLPDPAGARVVAGACTEIYLNSSVGLLTYLVTSPEARGRGLARRLCDEVLQLVHRRAPLQELSLVVLECHRSGVPDAVMAAHARLAAYERLGWWGFDQLPFVAPAVSEGMSTLVRNAAI